MEEMIGQIEDMRDEVADELAFTRTLEGHVFLEAVQENLLRARRYMKAALEAETEASNQLLLMEVSR